MDYDNILADNLRNNRIDNKKNLGLFLLMSTIFLYLIISGTYIYADEKVGWKIFKEKDGLFTIKYPSNWSPQKIDLDEKSYIEGIPSIHIKFIYAGSGSSHAVLTIFAQESILSNATDLMDSFFASLSHSKYKLLQPVECERYKINQINACSIIVSYKKVEVKGEPVANELDIGTVDENGIKYIFAYSATKDLFDDLLPVVEEMIKSFTVRGISSPDGEPTTGTKDLPELPPLQNSPAS